MHLPLMASPRDNHADEAQRGSNSSRKQPYSLEQRLGLGVERLASCRLATNSNEAREVQGLACRLDSVSPLLETGVRKVPLGACRGSLGHDLAELVLLELVLGHPRSSLRLVALKTLALACLPLAMTLTLFAFMTFFMAFMAPFFAFMAFMAAAFFMGSAIAVKWMLGEGDVADLW